MTNQEILNLEFYSNDFNEYITIHRFLLEVICTLFSEFERFDSKRPFGNSAWENDLAICLIKNDVINGNIKYYKDTTLIEHFDYDTDEFSDLINSIIKDVFKKYNSNKLNKLPDNYNFEVGM